MPLTAMNNYNTENATRKAEVLQVCDYKGLTLKEIKCAGITAWQVPGMPHLYASFTDAAAAVSARERA